MTPDTDHSPAVPGAGGPPNRAATEAGTRPRVGLLWGISVSIVAIDQAAKVLVDLTLPVYSSVTVVPNLLNLVHVRNAGMAFGFMNDFDHPMRAVFTTVLALVALASIGYYARHVHPEERFARVGLSLIIGGAIGNLVDRVRQGFVVDFVDVYWRGWHFWAFNVADAAITVGAGLVLIQIFFMSGHASHPVPDR